jgi:hypothetical protein
VTSNTKEKKMKTILMYGIILATLTSSISQAKVKCNINASSNHDWTFDKILFSEEIPDGSLNTVVISRDSQAVTAKQLPEEFTPGEAISLDGSTLVSFGQASPGVRSIGVAKFTVTDKVKNQVDITPIAIASGPVTDKNLNLNVKGSNLNIMCWKTDVLLKQ